MERRCPRPNLILAATLALGLLPGPATSQPPATQLDANQVTWTGLRYEASKFFVTVRSEVQLGTLSPAATASALKPPHQSTGLTPGAEPLWHLALTTTFLGRENRDQLWFSSQGAAFQQLSERRGGKPYTKVFRFTTEGTSLRRIAPASEAEEKKPESGWTKVRDEFFPYQAAQAGCTVVSDPGALFYLVSAANLSAGGKPLRICAFFGKVLNLLEIERLGEKRVEVDYEIHQNGQTGRRRGEVQTVRLAVRARALLPGQENAQLQVLGLKGDVEVYFDPVHRLPVQVSGDLPRAGRVNVQLVEADLR